MFEQFTLIELEWNRWNGFIFSVLRVNDRSLIGISFGWKSYLYISILFFTIEFEFD